MSSAVQTLNSHWGKGQVLSWRSPPPGTVSFHPCPTQKSHRFITRGGSYFVNLVKEVEYLLVRLGLLEDLGPVLFLALLLVLRLQRIQRLHQFESFQPFASLGIGKMSLQ